MNGMDNMQENVLVSNRSDTSRGMKSKQRAVLGVLTENEQRNRSFTQVGQAFKQSSETSQNTFLGCLSSSSFDVHLDVSCEVVLAASGEVETPELHLLDEDDAALQNEDCRLLLELSSGSFVAIPAPSEDVMAPPDMLWWSEYAQDIHQHLRKREVKFRPRQDYMRAHPEISAYMWAVLVDWLVEVGEEYHLCTETLHLAVTYLDHFLASTKSVRRGMLQLVGVAAILLAAKYEEVSPPEMDELVYVADGTYTKDQLIHMEHIVLKGLAFDLAVPTTHQFIRQFILTHTVCSKTKNLALYLAELSLLEVSLFLHYMPSMIAAAAYCLANYTVNRDLWPEALHAFSGYTITQIVPCLADLHQIYTGAENRPEQIIREKYRSSKYDRVSLITPPPTLPPFSSPEAPPLS